MKLIFILKLCSEVFTVLLMFDQCQSYQIVPSLTDKLWKTAVNK